MRWLRVAIPPRSAPPLQVLTARHLRLDVKSSAAEWDGAQYQANVGSWMYYLPALHAQVFHSRDGMLDCIHPSRPDARALEAGARVGRYRADDWRRALSTPTTRRMAEIWWASLMLWKAGLGPQPLGVCFMDQMSRDGRDLGAACGLLTQNVFRLPRKRKCLRRDVEIAGVVPDGILSCVRQQVRGYVIDLCSVIGCTPSLPLTTRTAPHPAGRSELRQGDQRNARPHVM